MIAGAVMVRWGLLGAVCALPFLLSAAALMHHQQRNPRRRGGWLPEPAGPWIEAQIAHRQVPVRLEVHRQDGMDGYWPTLSVIGLSERTWGGCRPGDWAIAAHELGHARNVGSHPVVAQLLPGARLVHGLAWRGTVASLLVAALLGQPWVLGVGLALLVATVTAGAVVCADELAASHFAWGLLADDPRLRGPDRRVAVESMAGAASVYAFGLVGQLAVLCAWPAIAQLAQTAPATQPGAVSTPGVWLLIVFMPMLALRAAHVLNQVLAPEPVTTDFRLFSVLNREARWEFLAGIGVMLIAVLLHDQGTSGVFALSMLLATTTAIGPVSGLLRALVLLPLLLLLHRSSARTEAEDAHFFPDAPVEEGTPALMALYSDPPWTLRVSWLAQLAYVPLLGVLGLNLLG